MFVHPMLNLLLQIRPAKRYESAAIQRLNDLCGLGRWPASDYAAAISLNDFSLQVAFADGTLAGFYLARLVGPDLELLKLAVDASFRRHGIAAALLGRCLDWGRQSVCEDCFLEVRKSNTPAIRLYERFGFGQIDIRRRYYHDPVEDAIVMSRGLRRRQPAALES
jgi:[ribosomal protein S18]-alanine N-acetyltransferase